MINFKNIKDLYISNNKYCTMYFIEVFSYKKEFNIGNFSQESYPLID